MKFALIIILAVAGCPVDIRTESTFPDADSCIVAAENAELTGENQAECLPLTPEAEIELRDYMAASAAFKSVD